MRVSHQTEAFNQGEIDVVVTTENGPSVSTSNGEATISLGSPANPYDVIDLELRTNTFFQDNYGYEEAVPFTVSFEGYDSSAGQYVVTELFSGEVLAAQSATPVEPPVEPPTEEPEGAAANVQLITVVSTESGNKYAIDGVQQESLNLVEGETYVFDWSVASGHPFRFSDPDGTHGGCGEYSDGVVVDERRFTTTITVAKGAPDLYYYCDFHPGMGGSAETLSLSLEDMLIADMAPGGADDGHIDLVSIDNEELSDAGLSSWRLCLCGSLLWWCGCICCRWWYFGYRFCREMRTPSY